MQRLDIFQSLWARDRALAGTGLGIEGVCFSRTVEDLRLPLRLAAEYPVRHLNLQPAIRPRRVADGLPLLDGWAESLMLLDRVRALWHAA